MPRQADHPRFQAEPFAAELRAQADVAGGLEELGFELDVPEGVAALAALGRQPVEVAGRGELHGLEVQLRRGAADDEGQVVRRAGRRSQRLHFAGHEREQGFGVQDGLGLLEQQGLVGRAAALGDAEQAVFVAADRIEFDLRGQIAVRVDFLVHGQGRVLRVAQVALRISLENTPGQRLLVAVAAEHPLALLADDDGCPGVLAHGEDHLGGDDGVLQQLQSHVTVVGGALRIIEDAGEQLQVGRPIQMRDIGKGLPGQQRQPFRCDFEDLGALESADGNMPAREQSVMGVFCDRRKHLLKMESVHGGDPF